MSAEAASNTKSSNSKTAPQDDQHVIESIKTEVSIQVDDPELSSKANDFASPRRTSHLFFNNKFNIPSPLGIFMIVGLLGYGALTMVLSHVYAECEGIRTRYFDLRLIGVPTLLLYLFTCFKDPGFIRGSPVTLKEFQENLKDYVCVECLVKKDFTSGRVTHCKQCRCCVVDTDHHCFAFANCITTKTLKYFYVCIFLGVVSQFFLYFQAFKIFTYCF